MKNHKLKLEILGRGIAWLDTGTFESLQDASLFIKTLEMRQGLKIGCPEEVAWRLNYINDKELDAISNKYANNPYGNYLKKILNEKDIWLKIEILNLLLSETFNWFMLSY